GAVAGPELRILIRLCNDVQMVSDNGEIGRVRSTLARRNVGDAVGAFGCAVRAPQFRSAARISCSEVELPMTRGELGRSRAVGAGNDVLHHSSPAGRAVAG